MFDTVLGHTSFVPFTGYATHARGFFTALNQLINTRVRNFAYTPDLSHLTQVQKDMVVEQTWAQAPYSIGTPYNRLPYEKVLNIILLETNHMWFNEHYSGPKICYNVWESTRQPYGFFNKMKEFDQVWVPTQWQRQCTIDQGMPEHKVKVVPEAVDGNIFHPAENAPSNEKFKFLIFGRWDYRKSTTEMIDAFLKEFGPDEQVELIISVDNPYPVDGMHSTIERLTHHKFLDDRITNIGFVSNDEYVKHLQRGNCLLHCSRSEGWGLVAIEGLACGIPTIVADWGATLEFADGYAHKVNIKDFKKPVNVFMQGNDVPGLICEPDYDHLRQVMREVYTNYEQHKIKALEDSVKVRERFTWENAAKIAMDIIDEMDNSKYYPVRLNLGSGGDFIDGYTNIDLHVPNAIKMDVRKLEYDDESVDNIYSSHLLEHFRKDEVQPLLNEWFRVLKKGTTLNLLIPNLEWCAKNFINSQENDRWGLPIDMIFGNQNNEGEYHKTGFTQERVRSLLNNAGFTDISIGEMLSHGQQCYKISCRKPYSLNDECFILDCYLDTQEKIDMTNEIIDKMKSYSRPIVLITHYDVPPDIQKKVDYVVYDSRNIMADSWEMVHWFVKDDIKILYTNPRGYKYHAAAIYVSLKNAVNLISGKYKFAHFVEYDVNIDMLDEYLTGTRNAFKNKKKFISLPYTTHSDKTTQTGITTNIFSFDIDWLSDILPEINSWQEYEQAPGPGANAIFEDWLYTLVVRRKGVQDIELLPLNVENRIEREGHCHFVLSETESNELVLFIINVDMVNSYDYTIDYNGEIIESVIKPYSYTYSILKKEGTIKCTQGRTYVEHNIKKDGTYDKTRFKFRDDRIKCVEWNPNDNKGWLYVVPNVYYTFHEGAKADIQGIDDGTMYHVEFRDGDTGLLAHQSDIKVNNWTKAYRQYFVNWHVTVTNKDTGQLISEHRYDAKNKNVMICMTSKQIGDTIAWIPYVDEFRKKHQCNVFLSTFHNNLFKHSYPEIIFFEPGTSIENIYAIYSLGIWDNDYNKHKNHWKTVPLQQVSSDILGLDYVEVKPKISVPIKPRPIKEKYIVLTEYSTLQAKFWNHQGGWQTVVDHFNSVGYKVMVISKEKTNLKNIIDMTDKPLEESINNIRHAEMFIGISCGPTWLAWALNVPTVLISGYSSEWAEMKDCVRIINKDVCNGCFNDKELFFDRGNWNWCPRSKNFICSVSITPQLVISEIEKKFTKV